MRRDKIISSETGAWIKVLWCKLLENTKIIKKMFDTKLD
jgi:hypothetical protein